MLLKKMYGGISKTRAVLHPSHHFPKPLNFTTMPVDSFLTVNPSAWFFDEPRKNDNGGSNMNVATILGGGPDDKPRFEIPERVTIPFGLEDGLEATSRKKMELSFSRDSGIVAAATRIDDFILDWTLINCERVFKKKMTREGISTLYRPLVTMPDAVAKRPLMRVKVNAQGKYKTKVFIILGDTKYRVGNLEDLQSGCEIVPILEVGGVWFVAKGFGVTLVANSILVYPSARRNAGIDDFNLPAGMECVGGAAAADDKPAAMEQ